MRYAGGFSGVNGSCVQVVAIELKLVALDPYTLLDHLVEAY